MYQRQNVSTAKRIVGKTYWRQNILATNPRCGKNISGKTYLLQNVYAQNISATK